MGSERRIKYFVNLTTGLEYLDELINTIGTIHFLRIQSTWLEQGHFEHVLVDLDNNFLMSLAIGDRCIVLDKTSRYVGRRPSRAIWQGIEFVKYCLNRSWFGKEIECLYGQHVHFRKVYNNLHKKTKRKLKYFKKFLLIKDLTIETECDKTLNDGNDQYFRAIVERYFKNG